MLEGPKQWIQLDEGSNSAIGYPPWNGGAGLLLLGLEVERRAASLLAHKPKSYKAIKKDLIQKSLSTKSHSFVNRAVRAYDESKPVETALQIIEVDCEIPLNELSQQSECVSRTVFRSSFAQDHDYCFGIIDNSSHY